ncbi:nadh-quinone oxidoreductase subunit k : NADH-quinone oxidoreductase subunit K OS=Singulisphaera acidiphila (strain ATCC BAA-1392 / DSM 18658 / VKM B-2454 / MOB10) GN=nuoK PE=3 SV=1: Oxidored_q2 [Gemmata massiliana]|uniref:NADH-quinone oxidoreductase subunit K n=1 Tax=Gemmata massiliana TaxID=1210884 RepID=A0A6P2D0Q1_9BACT|nr:NADH-quinone oxidoreductase subunit NuoK [Gemmata massiliana]VTR94407.1 nadh-quinone oxidoreductase subunit k : NADH-quinone oxidoreductase subunit K OS=Singulisphaera acidiphila (strain ATCC BAA-1392 / DSM 18658 / VKM B-2454 / MOB10) GN=nuoK PE=3 SV=1: Oxidored_q2 [Gemmata massiliana]
MILTLWHFLAVAAALFGIGLVGFLTRRNLITMFLCAEMMLQGVAINFVAFARYHGNLQGQVFVLFILAVAACEAGVALALFVSLYRRRRSLDVSDWQELRELGIPAAVDEEPLEQAPVEPEPTLTPAGARPQPIAEEAVRV